MFVPYHDVLYRDPMSRDTWLPTGDSGCGLDKWMHRSLSPDSYNGSPQASRPSPTNAVGPPVDDYQDGTRPLISGKHPSTRGNVALCGLRAAGAVLMAALVTAGCRTTPQVQDTGGTSPGQPRTGSGGGPAEAAWGRTRQSRPLHRGGDHRAVGGRSQGPAARMTEAAVGELRRLGVEDRAMPTKAVQHPARLSVHGRLARPDRLPGRPRTNGVAPPDAPYPTTGHGRAAESRVDRHPDQHPQRHHHRYRA